MISFETICSSKWMLFTIIRHKTHFENLLFDRNSIMWKWENNAESYRIAHMNPSHTHTVLVFGVLHSSADIPFKVRWFVVAIRFILFSSHISTTTAKSHMHATLKTYERYVTASIYLPSPSYLHGDSFVFFVLFLCDVFALKPQKRQNM